jgi:glycosyltransferase involved in cell wall biosynthesis
MRILMISDVFFPRINGVSTSIQTFVDAFLEMGHEVTLIAPHYPGVDQEPFDIIRIPSRQLPFDPEDRLMSLRKIKKLVPGLRQQGFDIVHVHTPFVAHYAGVYLGKALGLRVVTSYHTFFEAYFEKYLPRLPKRLLRAIARNFSRSQCNAVDGVISPSRQMSDKLREYGVTQRIDIVPTGLPPICFEARDTAGFRACYNIPDNAFLLLYVGRVAFEKNIGFLIEMFEQVVAAAPHAHFLVTGEGPALKSLKKQASDAVCSQHIHFAGYLDRNTQLLTCYQSSNCFVFASETETQGLVLLEAMASSIPVVSVASMGSKDVLVEGEGCYIADLDHESFASKVVLLANQPERAQSLSKKGRAYAEAWSAKAKAKEMLIFYQNILNADIEGELE